MPKLSWAWDMDSWYEAGYAASGRSTCKEARCKKTIEKGELRVGICCVGGDNGGSQLGWYHPACLWLTFQYKSNANQPITAVSQIRGLSDLSKDDQKVFRDLVANPSSAQANGPKVPTDIEVLLNTSGVTPVLEVKGNTFAIKDELKAKGGKWNGDQKAWLFIDDAKQKAVLELLGVSAASLKRDAPLKVGDEDAPPTKKARGEKAVAPVPPAKAAAPAKVKGSTTPESAGLLDKATAAILEALCVLRGVAKSGTKDQKAARLVAAAESDPNGSLEYRKQIASLVSAGNFPPLTVEALPWDAKGKLR